MAVIAIDRDEIAPRWLKRTQLIKYINRSYPTILLYMRRERDPFPAPKDLGDLKNTWDRFEVDAWMERQPSRSVSDPRATEHGRMMVNARPDRQKRVAKRKLIPRKALEAERGAGR